MVCQEILDDLNVYFDWWELLEAECVSIVLSFSNFGLDMNKPRFVMLYFLCINNTLEY